MLCETGVTLSPSRTNPVQVLKLNDHCIRFPTDGLEPGTGYEARISYPASLPTDIFVSLTTAEGENLPKPGNRRLLNVEKLMFHTEPHQPTVQGQQPWVQVHAQLAGVHWSGPSSPQAHQELLFDIVLEPVALGVPREAWPVALIALVLMAVSAAIAPLLAQWAKRILFLNPSGSSTTKLQ
eukprot:CAMPEP_0114294352 /NCGR_PEP_ID=MMETSP0059-20121206/10081_1 /TAXON_ID=36894 /ORGANISM="Pyramimonas parkeae, Strain CCMP726" /LENGTH=180 /DNA_ID=CAMNT_0001416125 /DNA_START=284 /DNA_END=826 /DNA_ORIENTATION=+